ncbi:MAG: hypothetical protein WC707_02535 [Candidatus Babeliaceae bacterium]|jgi:hypothetical protein
MKVSILLLSVIFSISSLIAMENDSALAECPMNSGGIQSLEDNTAHKLQAEKNLARLLEDPQGLLAEMKQIRKNFSAEMSKYGADFNETTHRQVVQDFEKECTFFLLTECAAESCLLRRSNNPRYRAAFEDRVANALSDKLSNDTLIRCLSYGSGGLLSDFRILSKALSKKPCAQLKIDLIDTLFKPELLGAVHEEEFSHNPRIGTLFIEQFTRQLKNNFSQAAISVSVHSSIVNYCNQYAKTMRREAPDMIFAADIDSDSGYNDYNKLCFNMLRIKPHAYNLLLSKKASDKASLDTLSISNGKLSVHSEEIK